MTTLSLRTRHIVTIAVFVAVAAVALAVDDARGRPLNLIPILAVGLSILSVLVDAYYSARATERRERLSALEAATPLASLREKLIRDLIAARRELTRTRTEAEEIGVANALSQLDRESTISLLRAATRPTDRDLWKERAMGFLLGIAASMIASYLYSALLPASNA